MRKSELIKADVSEPHLTLASAPRASSFLFFSGSDEETHSMLSSVVPSRSVSSDSRSLFFAVERTTCVRRELRVELVPRLEAATAAASVGAEPAGVHTWWIFDLWAWLTHIKQSASFILKEKKKREKN